MRKYVVDVLDFAAAVEAVSKRSVEFGRSDDPIPEVPVIRTEKAWTKAGQKRKAAKIVNDGSNRYLTILRKEGEPVTSLTYPDTLWHWKLMAEANLIPHFYGRDEWGVKQYGFRPPEVTQRLVEEFEAQQAVFRRSGQIVVEDAIQDWDNTYAAAYEAAVTDALEELQKSA